MARKALAKKSLAGTRKSDVNKRRKGFLAWFFPWLRRFGIALAVIVGVVWVGSWVVLSGAAQKSIDWTKGQIVEAAADMGFRVETILVEGRKNVDGEMLLALLNVQKGDPLFAFDPHRAKALIEQIGWVQTAHVERRLPHTLYIGLEERQPMALWKVNGEFRLIDTDARVIPEDDIAAYKGLMIIGGQGAKDHILALMPDLQKQPKVFEKISGAYRIGDRRWDLILKAGARVQLPENDLSQALERLAQAHEKNQMLDQKVLSFDLREYDRISVRTKPGQVKEYKAGLLSSAAAGNTI